MSEFSMLLPVVSQAVRSAGLTLKTRFSLASRPASSESLLKLIQANDDSVAPPLRAALTRATPGSRWVEDEEGGGILPDGDWWVADPVEGNVNHVHGGTQWGVTATLVRDNIPVLTVAYLPLADETFTAIKGGGAYRDRTRLAVSSKNDLAAALLSTGQAKPGEDVSTYRLIGRSVEAMLSDALLVRMAVPATFELVEVAAGRMDGFWQHSQVHTGLLSGALLVAEAGGVVTDTRGNPWTLGSPDFLATSPGIHADTVRTLSKIHKGTSI